MKKYFLIAFAMCLMGMVTSCGDKNDRALDKCEKLVKKASKESDPEKKGEILVELQDVVSSINEDELTPEQKRRAEKIAADVWQVSD